MWFYCHCYRETTSEETRGRRLENEDQGWMISYKTKVGSKSIGEQKTVVPPTPAPSKVFLSKIKEMERESDTSSITNWWSMDRMSSKKKTKDHSVQK